MKYKTAYFDDEEVFATHPNFIRVSNLPYNMRQLIDDIAIKLVFDSRGGFYDEKQRIIHTNDTLILFLKKINHVRDERKRNSKLILSNWIKYSNIECNKLMDKNLINIILKYLTTMEFDLQTLHISAVWWWTMSRYND